MGGEKFKEIPAKGEEGGDGVLELLAEGGGVGGVGGGVGEAGFRVCNNGVCCSVMVAEEVFDVDDEDDSDANVAAVEGGVNVVDDGVDELLLMLLKAHVVTGDDVNDNGGVGVGDVADDGCDESVFNVDDGEDDDDINEGDDDEDDAFAVLC